ncbi:MAG: hypothetical protein IKG42_02765 [Clostridia bacterium]|nr:hypothetical protein [Clostridia bacterium]
MKSKVAGILILILLTFAVVPAKSYCTENSTPITFSRESYNQLVNAGKVMKLSYGLNPVYSSINASKLTWEAGIRVVTAVLLFPVVLIQRCISIVSTGDPLGTITVESLVLNRNDLVNANYTETSNNNYNNMIKQSVVGWFYAIRMLTIAISIVVLIYIGIRMALSSISSEKAKYKSMFIDWFISLGIVFFMQYIIVFFMMLSDTIVELFANINISSFESKLGIINLLLDKNTGLVYVAIVIMYFIIVFYQIKFFLFYVRRFLAVGFLIIIAPLITITYAIDKAKDRKSQIFNTWMREFLGNMFIQPLHALIYMVFIVSANAIFEIAPILSLIIFVMLSRAEKVMKNIFGLKKMASMRDMHEMMK